MNSSTAASASAATSSTTRTSGGEAAFGSMILSGGSYPPTPGSQPVEALPDQRREHPAKGLVLLRTEAPTNLLLRRRHRLRRLAALLLAFRGQAHGLRACVVRVLRASHQPEANQVVDHLHHGLLGDPRPGREV